VKRLLIALLLACCARGKPEIPILNYHSVGDAVAEYTVEARDFDQQLDWLAGQRFRTISLRELADSRAKAAPLPQRAIILTFDDGTEDAVRLVLPALSKRGMRGTFFIVTNFVGQPGYLTWDAVRALSAAGMEIGSHSETHPRLSEASDDRIRIELVASKARLEAELRHPLEALAYPYNSVRSRIIAFARDAGYRVAVSGAAHGGADLLNLRRTTITGTTTMEQFQKACER
jgi:peptidoglycan/xylan/chitin deacetylase (PgdA/CDA1 family)